VFHNIVIALAPTDTAREAFDQGLELARALRARIHLVSAYDEHADDDTARRHAEGHLESAAAPLRAGGAEVATHALPGDAARALLRVAEDVGADMIVVGNKGAQGARRVLGSIASTVLAHAPCTVTVVHTT
jgi:nucleotide-binding universal stress UspA family protein